MKQKLGAVLFVVTLTVGLVACSWENKAKQVAIYSGNQDATAFESENVTIEQLTPELLLTELNHRGVVSADVKINKFEELVVDEKKAINLDLSKEYGTYIMTQGTTGEWISIGSICNTFLKAYDCECIQITVDGETLKTGHAQYPDYMSEFE